MAPDLTDDTFEDIDLSSEPHRETDGPEVVGRVLGVELARAQDVGIAQAHVPSGHGDAELEIADQRLLVHAAAVAEGIAVEENVARVGAPSQEWRYKPTGDKPADMGPPGNPA